MRIIKIGDKEIGLKASPLALLYYQQDFKKDLIADLMSLQGLTKFAEGDYSALNSVLFLQILYVLNKAYNFGKKFPDFNRWLAEFDSIDLMEIIPELVEEIEDGFFRSAGLQQPAEPAAGQHRESGSESAGDREEDGVDLPRDE